MIAVAVPRRTVVDTAIAGVMLGYAVHVAQTIDLHGLAQGALPIAVASLTVMGMFLVGPWGRGKASAVPPNSDDWKAKAPPHIIEGKLLPVSTARQSPTRALPSPQMRLVSDVRNELHATALTQVHWNPVDHVNESEEQAPVNALGYRPLERAANAWEMAGFIVDPSDAAWHLMRWNVEQIARRSTTAVIEAVVTAARRQWHLGPVPLKKDGFIADILAAPEVAALGALKPRMDVVRKILDGEHPTLIRAAKRSASGANRNF